MTEIVEQLEGLRASGVYRRMRRVSGPQGPHIVLDGRPVLTLCSDNALGLADHPRVRQAAADAAMRWGAGAGAGPLACGTMTVHRRLEERLAAFHGTRAALTLGSSEQAAAAAVGALARRDETIFADALSQASIAAACRIAEAQVFVYDHGDVDHLAWGLARAEGRGALIVTDGVFSVEGDVAPLEQIVDLAQHHDARVVVDESHGLGALGPGGRGAVAAAGVADEVDVVLGSLGTTLGAQGAYVACDAQTAQHLVNAGPAFACGTPPGPPAVAAALAALDLLEAEPRRVDKLRANAATLREALAADGWDVGDSCSQIVSLAIGDAATTLRVADAALARGVFAYAAGPPVAPRRSTRLRLAAMATHGKAELRTAARTITTAARACGIEPAALSSITAARIARSDADDVGAGVAQAA